MAWRVFKPRRSINSSVKTGSKKDIVLEDGELMVVRKEQDGEYVKGVKSDIYIGNGVTTMEELKPAVYGDTSEEPINIINDQSQTTSDALSNVVNGRSLGQLLGSLKRAIETAGSQTINDFTPATSSMAGASGLVPGPAAGRQNYVLTGGGWKSQAPTAGKANTATFAMKDTSSQDITDTYIKNITVYGTTLTYTKGNGNNSTVALQDNNNTYPLAIKDVSANGSSLTFTHYNNDITTIEVSSGGTYSPFTPPTQQLDGESGLVPAPLAGQQNYILSASGWVEGSSGEADIDYSAVKTKVVKSETNGNLIVDNEELVVYDDQEIQAKSSADLPYTFRQDGSSITFNYFANEKDILADYPQPYLDMYGLMPQSLSSTDDKPIRIVLKPYYDNGYDTVWKGGEGKSKVRFTGLIGLTVNDQQGYGMLYGDENDGIVLDSEHQEISSHSPFEITLVSGASLNYGTKYILNGLGKDSSGLYFEVITSSSTKIGTEVVFTGANSVTIKLKGDNGFDFGSIEKIQPMVRLATETDDNYVPYENIGSMRGYGSEFVLVQTNESLDYSEVKEPSKEFYFNAGSRYISSNRYLGSNSHYGTFEAPNGVVYKAKYTQEITDGTNIYYIEYYTNNYLLDVGETYIHQYAFYNDDGSSYGEGERFYRRNDATIDGYYQWKLNDNEWTSNELIPLIGDLFLSKGQYKEDSNEVIWYAVDYNISYFTREAEAAFLDDTGIYSSILDFGLGSRYDNISAIIYNFHEDYTSNFKYISDRDICDMDNWHQPSEGAFVIILNDSYSLGSVFRSGNYIGELNLYEKTKSTFTLYNYSNYELIPIENTNGEFIFNCRPGNALSRHTYNKYLTGDLFELKGFAEQSRLVEYVDSSSLINTETMMSVYPKKLIAPNEINISIDGQGGYKSEEPVAWNETNKKVNIFAFDNWSKTGNNITVTRYISKGYEEFYNYASSSYSSVTVNITLCNNLDTYITNGTPLCLAVKAYDSYGDDLININNSICYMYLSKTASYTNNAITIKMNDYNQAKTIEYDSSYKYLGITYTFNGMGKSYGGSFYLSPIIRKVNSYTYATDEWGGTNTKSFPYTFIDNPYGWLPSKRCGISALSVEHEYGTAEQMKIVITKNELYHYDEDDYSDFYENNNNSKIFLADFSGIDFYNIKCPYNDRNYKYFYHLTRLSIDSDNFDYNYYSIQDLDDYGGTVEIWSNVPIIGAGQYHYYFNTNTSEYVLFDYSVINSFDQNLFYLNLADCKSEYTAKDKMNRILGSNGSNKWNNGRSNIPRFSSSTDSDAIGYATTLMNMALNNDYYGIKVDLKTHKIYKLYDYIPKFYNEIGDFDSYDESVFNNTLLWEDWKSEYADCRYDDVPATGAAALFRADKYYRNGSYVDSPYCWDIPIILEYTNEKLSEEDLILPLSSTDFNHVVNIYGVLCSNEFSRYNLTRRGTLYMTYSISGFAYTEDIDSIKYDLSTNYLSKDDLDNTDFDFGFEG